MKLLLIYTGVNEFKIRLEVLQVEFTIQLIQKESLNCDPQLFFDLRHSSITFLNLAAPCIQTEWTPLFPHKKEKWPPGPCLDAWSTKGLPCLPGSARAALIASCPFSIWALKQATQKHHDGFFILKTWLNWGTPYCHSHFPVRLCLASPRNRVTVGQFYLTTEAAWRPLNHMESRGTSRGVQ